MSCSVAHPSLRSVYVVWCGLYHRFFPVLTMLLLTSLSILYPHPYHLHPLLLLLLLLCYHRPVYPTFS